MTILFQVFLKRSADNDSFDQKTTQGKGRIEKQTFPSIMAPVSAGGPVLLAS